MGVKCCNIYEEEMKRASSLSLTGVDGVLGAIDLNPFFQYSTFKISWKESIKWLYFLGLIVGKSEKSCGGQPVEDSSILAALAFFPQASPNPHKNSQSKKTFDSKKDQQNGKKMQPLTLTMLFDLSKIIIS